LSYLPVKGDKLALAQLLAITGHSQNYESTKGIIRVLNLDFYFFHLFLLSYSLSRPSPPSRLPFSASRDHSTDSALLVFSSSFFIVFCSLSSPVIIPVLPHLLLCWTHFSLSISLLSAFLDSLVFLRFLYVSSSPFLVHFSLFIPVLYITFDIPSTPP